MIIAKTCQVTRFNTQVDALRKVIIKDVLKGSSSERVQRTTKLCQEITQISERLIKLEDMLVDGQIQSKEYHKIKTRYAEMKSRSEKEIAEISNTKGQHEKQLLRAIELLSGVGAFY